LASNRVASQPSVTAPTNPWFPTAEMEIALAIVVYNSSFSIARWRIDGTTGRPTLEDVPRMSCFAGGLRTYFFQDLLHALLRVEALVEFESQLWNATKAQNWRQRTAKSTREQLQLFDTLTAFNVTALAHEQSNADPCHAQIVANTYIGDDNVSQPIIADLGDQEVSNIISDCLSNSLGASTRFAQNYSS